MSSSHAHSEHALLATAWRTAQRLRFRLDELLHSPKTWTLAIVLACLWLSLRVGRRPNPRILMQLAALGMGLGLLARPVLGLVGLIAAALVVPLQISTGSAVYLNAATLLVPAMALIWLLDRLFHGGFRVLSSRPNRPLALFLLSGLLSLLVGSALWDPAVPWDGDFFLVQIAQWCVFAFSALAFWLMGNLVRDERWLRRLTWTFLLLGGGLAILRMAPGVGRFATRLTTEAFIRAPLWVLLAALAGGQLLWDEKLTPGRRLYLLLVLGATLYYAFIQQREAASNWVGVGGVLGLLLWLRFPRLRWVALAFLLLLTISGLLWPMIYHFAGGDREWTESGGSRMVLITRVVEVTLRNPILGLGPAAYRRYAGMEPLAYGMALWWQPLISSHNNYVDLFSHTGLVGLGIFLWFMVEVALLGLRLRRRYRSGFAAGYVNGMVGAWAGTMVTMLLADWFLPYVYNIGFPGFQASVLVWLFLGGLLAVEHWDMRGGEATKDTNFTN